VTDQLDFFSAPQSVAKTLPYQRHSATSKAAAKSMERVSETQCMAVLTYMRSRVIGATREEVSHYLCRPIQSICARFDELIKQGRIRDTGRTRPTVSKRKASVYEVVK
jgi:CRP-like cAMP-binding protein